MNGVEEVSGWIEKRAKTHGVAFVGFGLFDTHQITKSVDVLVDILRKIICQNKGAGQGLC
jgi:hypothetical protein